MLLPCELIIEIMLRLPVKSLVRFKTVCKSWLSLISDPRFATSHFKLVAISTERLVFLAPTTPEIKSIDLTMPLNDDSTSITLKPKFLPSTYPFTIVGSCRGFLLLQCFISLWVWNPSTGEHKKISRSPIVSNMNTFFTPFLYGFGYDSSKDDYVVVQASFNSHDDHYQTHVEVFSLRANKWKEIEGVHLPYMHCCNDIGVGLFLNDAIHWFGFRYDESMNVIVAFDLMTMSFSEVLGPIDFDWDFNLCNLGILGKYLGLCAVGYVPSHTAKIWIMEAYKVQSSWTKTIEIPLHDIPTQFFSLICSTKSGDIVGQDCNNGLLKCNYKGQLQEYQSNCCDLYGSQVVVMYTESLLSLPCGNEQAKEDD